MIDINNIICCPFCKGDLKTNGNVRQTGLPKKDTIFYYCLRCNHRFPLSDSIVDFLPKASKKTSLAQQMMESSSIVKKYESKSWRGSRLFATFAGITLKEEMALIDKISHINQNDTVLDLACGTGLYTRYFAKKSNQRKVIGLDISWPMLRYAVNKINDQKIENVDFLHGDAHYLPFKNSTINSVVCCGSLHLFSNVDQVLKEISRVIKPHGHFAIAVFFVKSNLIGRLKAYYREKVWGIHSFSEKEIKGLMQKANFKPTIFHSWGVWMIANGISLPMI